MVSKETNLQINGSSAGAGGEEKQRRRMLAALLLLLIALIVVLIKDREFWFSSNQPSASVVAEQLPPPAAPVASPQSVPVPTAQTAPSPQPAQAQTKAKSKKAKGKTPKIQTPQAQPPIPADNSQAAAGPVITATNRTVLPPLEVEVVAGNQHRALSPANNSVKVEMESSSASALPAATAPSQQQSSASTTPDASPEVTLPQATAERVTRSVKPDYPMLAKQMKVQGAVVLQALIDKAGRIQELHVVTGPTILATAAQEAVKQWRFKPYYQQGQAVETEARITVNFTISTY
jgi:TonB family protein